MKEITRQEALDITLETLEKAEKQRHQEATEEAMIGTQYLEKLWLVGQAYTDYHPQAWELVGVFSTKEKAVAACKGRRYFVVPIELDFAASDETTPWPNCFFPKGKGFPGGY
jgi:hypothetical protein